MVSSLHFIMKQEIKSEMILGTLLAIYTVLTSGQGQGSRDVKVKDSIKPITLILMADELPFFVLL